MTTDFGVMSLERRDEVFVLTLTEGDNRFNPTSLKAWNAALDEVEASDGPAALVTVGTDRFYSNGLDLDWMGAQSDAGAASRQVIGDTIRLFGRMLSFPMYTVAAINGHAFAAGAMLAIAHDARVMRTDRGFFCFPEADLGMPLAPGMTALITARLDAQVAHEAIVTGRRYPADEALAKGIVDAVSPEAEVLRDAAALAVAQTGKARGTVGVLKRGLYADILPVLEAGELPT